VRPLVSEELIGTTKQLGDILFDFAGSKGE
jgi:hypothetical protein